MVKEITSLSVEQYFARYLQPSAFAKDPLN